MSRKESFSPWTYKPWWCQPWSILLTGAIIIGSIWVLTKNPWVTVVVGMPVIIWMGYFLLIWPKLMSAAILSGERLQAQDAVEKKEIKF